MRSGTVSVDPDCHRVTLQAHAVAWDVEICFATLHDFPNSPWLPSRNAFSAVG
jgi:hypothetical protein